MRITVNGEPREVREGLTLAQLIEELKVKIPYAVEHNRQLCPKSRHAHTVLHEGDCLEIVTIVGGG